jgi:hypothetical protein
LGGRERGRVACRDDATLHGDEAADVRDQRHHPEDRHQHEADDHDRRAAFIAHP